MTEKITRVDNLKGVRISGPNPDGTWNRVDYEHTSKDGYKEVTSIVPYPEYPGAECN